MSDSSMWHIYYHTRSGRQVWRMDSGWSQRKEDAKIFSTVEAKDLLRFLIERTGYDQSSLGTEEVIRIEGASAGS